ncbi:Rac3 in complex with crib domain of P21-activated kinase 1 [Flagelloscypha sp. PMI_526]|nr:Rac3 in complex with crib domain of P21-activated kinase 1 [Flagelloscypha sp. PMI_526]
MRQVKCVLDGHAGSGKGSLISAYLPNAAPQGETSQVILDNEPVALTVWKINRGEYESRLHGLGYIEPDMILFCCSVVHHEGLEFVLDRLAPQARHHCPSVAYLLVGTKADLTNDENELDRLRAARRGPIQREQGEAMARRVGAIGYMSCSAHSMDGVNEVFKAAVRIGCACSGLLKI